MLDAAASPSLWTVLISVVGGGTAIGLLNAYLNRATPRFQQLLLGAQTEKEREEARKFHAETDLSVARGAFELLDRVEAESKRKDARIADLECQARRLQAELIDCETKRAAGPLLD